MIFDDIADRFARHAPAVDYWSLRLVDTRDERLSVRQNVVEPPGRRQGRGAMITVGAGGGVGYAATADLGSGGLAEAARRATAWAERAAASGLLRPEHLPRPAGRRRCEAPARSSWTEVPLAERLELLARLSRRLEAAAGARRDELADWQATVRHRRVHTLLATCDGARLEHRHEALDPGLAAVASNGRDTQRRSHGEGSLARQGGLEQLRDVGFEEAAERVTGEALALLDAPACPSEVCDVVLLPGQMILQLHESVGHPLELDRILGDERNYAGGSFVTPEMFGSYRYGSELLDVTFDPGVPGELASYDFDDAGSAAERRHLIRGGILERPLGGATSQARAGLPGVACARASDWNRPPIDRMANLNLEPGVTPLAALIEGVERGVLMDANRSWSIDDRRDKFQFGCELGRVIRDGVPGELVRGPGYRGRSATFWRSLDGVGDGATRQVMGTPWCGKGEPNQLAAVGHAAPACRFRGVEVFGGDG